MYHNEARNNTGRAAPLYVQMICSFLQTFTEYIDGARLYLEADSVDLKDNVPGIREIKIYFAEFLRLLIDRFSRELISFA